MKITKSLKTLNELQSLIAEFSANFGTGDTEKAEEILISFEHLYPEVKEVSKPIAKSLDKLLKEYAEYWYALGY